MGRRTTPLLLFFSSFLFLLLASRSLYFGPLPSLPASLASSFVSFLSRPPVCPSVSLVRASREARSRTDRCQGQRARKGRSRACELIYRDARRPGGWSQGKRLPESPILEQISNHGKREESGGKAPKRKSASRGLGRASWGWVCRSSEPRCEEIEKKSYNQELAGFHECETVYLNRAKLCVEPENRSFRSLPFRLLFLLQVPTSRRCDFLAALSPNKHIYVFAKSCPSCPPRQQHSTFRAQGL